jgi:VCBS repeat-containing protein
MFGFGRKKKAPHSSEQKDQPVPAPSSGIKGSLISLEQRLMFDAAAAATASEVATEQVAQEQAEAAVSGEASHDLTGGEKGGGEDVVQALTNYMPAEKCVEVAFVDPTVPNYQELLAGMDPNIEVIMLDGGQDGVEQMASALEGRTGIDAIHLISHGSSGELQLGTGTLNAESMSSEYADEFATIRGTLSDQADLLVYGCNFGEGAEGADAVNLLAELTGADVAASSDGTGHIDLGGDWEFEVQVGSIETDLALTDTAQMNWAGILGTETVKDTFSSTSYSNNTGTQSWSTSWSESDAEGSGASGGDVRVNSGQLRIDAESVGNAISRGVNLSNATSATLTFNYTNDLEEGDRIELRVSTDGGTNYQTVSGGVFSNAANTGSGTKSVDLSSYMSANTRIQFIVTRADEGDRLYVDNVQVSYETGPANSPPTISSNGAGATASVSVAESSSTVTTVTGADADAGQSLTYSIAGGADAAQFTINSSTGQLSFLSAPNYEAPTDSGGNNVYDVTVQVSDGQGGTDTQAIAVTVANTNEAPTDLSLSANSVAENATTGTVVGTISGTDVDAGDTKTYSLTDTAGGRFAINSATGQLTVADGNLLNYESAASHTVTVRVTDSGGQSYTETFTINLTNVNEAPTGADATVTISEDTSHTLTTANFGFSDVDAGDSLSAVRIDTLPTAGTLTLSGVAVTAGQVVSAADITAGRLVFSPTADANGTSYASLTFSVQDSHSTYDATPNTLTFNVTAVNDAPTDLSLSANTVAENAATGTVVGTVTGTDVDAGDTKTYSLTDTAGGRFAIDASTGQLTVADGNLLNYESAASHTVTVRVTDSGGQSYTETFTINLSNENEAPTGADATVTISEDTSHTLTTANFGFSDIDAGDSHSAVRIDTLPTAGSLTLFGVAVTAGQVITVSDLTGGHLVFTPTADANGTGYASLTFSVQDSHSTYDTAPNTLAFNLTAVNDAPTDLSLSANSVAENAATSTVVGTISGTDVDAGDTKTYSLTDTAGGRFTIDPTTGVITVADGSLLNAEASTSHSVTVRVTDSGGQSYDETFTINLTNVNEGPTDLALSANTVAENATTGTVVGTVSGTDPDADDTKTYSLTDTAGGRFAIDASTGQLTVADGNLLNYESAASHTVTVRVTDSGGQSYTEIFTINLTNVNEGPSDLSLSASTVAEHATTGTVVGTVTGTDPDAGDTKTYSLTDTAGGRFAINASTGVITVADGSLLNYEAAASHSLTVQVTDSGGQSYTETFTINLTNVTEGPTNLNLPANTVSENATTGTVVGTISGTDPDAGDTKTYSLTDTAGGRFAINASTGELTVADGSLLNYENAASHSLMVQVTDSGGQSYTETFTINLTNVNEALVGTESTDAPIEDMAHTLATTTFGPHDTYGAPKTSASDPHVANDLEESGFPLANTFQNMKEITTEAPSTEIILTAERTHLSVASEEPIGNGVNSKEPQQSSTQNEKRGSDVPADQTDVHSSAAAEPERKEFLKPDDPIENVEESTALKLSATIGLAGVVLQNGLGNNTKLRRLISRPAGASNVSPEMIPQQSSVDDHASNQNGSEHSRSTAEDADQADP